MLLKISPHIFPHVLLCIFLYLPFTNSYTFNGFSIRDLEYTNSNFVAESQAWSASSLMGSNKYWTCSGTYFLNGYNILSTGSGQYFTKTYSNLPAHSYIYFSTKWWAFYTWDYPDDYFQLSFDSYTITAWSMTQGSFPSTCCGYICVPGFYIYGRFPHTASTLTVSFISQMDEPSTGEWWTVRDLDLLFTSTSSTSLTCAATTTTIPNLPSGWSCTCFTPGYYGSSCAYCDASCKGCWSSGSASCFACADGYGWSGTNCLKCHASCSVCFGTSNDQCKACNTGYYLFEENTCIASCSSPLIQTASDSKSIQLPAVSQIVCSYPCTEGLYLDWNGDCQGSCDSPLQATTEVTDLDPIDVCNYPCSIGQYLYWDGTCGSSCSTPVYSIPVYTGVYDGRYFCKFPCTTTANPIAYGDGSCKNTCPPPLLSSTLGGKEFCSTPCTNQNDYLYNDGSCSSTCQEHMKITSSSGQKLCGPACEDGYTLSGDGKCVSTSTSSSFSNTTKTVLKNSQITSSTTVQIASAINSGRAISISAVVGGRVFFNIKFLNISYSAELQQALKDWLPSFISLGLTPDLPESTVKSFPERSVPPTFEKYEVEASFFLNFWENLGILLMISCACIVLKLFEIFTTVKYLQGGIKKIKILMQNFLMMTLYGIYGDLVLFAILEYRTMKFNFDLSLLSWIMSAILLMIMLFCLGFHYKLLKKYQKLKNQPDLLESFNKDYEGVQALYRDFEDKSLSRQGFLIILTLRETAFSIVMSSLFDYPIIQVNILLITSICMLIYLIARKPFQSRFDYFQQIFFEIIGLIVNIGVFINAIQPINPLLESKTVWTIGRMILIMNLIFNFSSAGLMFIQILMIIKDHWDSYKEKKAKRSKVVNHIEEEPNEVQGKSLTTQTEPSMIGETFRNEQSRFIRRGGFML